MSARTRAYLMLLAAVIIWGVAGPVIKYTLYFVHPAVFLTIRFFITSLVMFPLVFVFQPHILRTLSHLSPKDWLLIIVCGLLGSTVQLGLLFWGTKYTSAIDSTVINSVSLIFIAIFGAYFLGDHVTKRERIGLIIAFIGSVLTVIEPLFSSGSHLTASSLWGNFLVFLANFAWVFYVIASKKQLRLNLTPLFLTTSMFFIGFISMSVISILVFPKPLFDFFLSPPPLYAMIGVLYMAIFSGALAYYFHDAANKTIETSEAEMFLYLSPVVTIPISYFWLKEPITVSFLISAGVITLGVLLAALKPHRKHYP